MAGVLANRLATHGSRKRHRISVLIVGDDDARQQLFRGFIAVSDGATLESLSYGHGAQLELADRGLILGVTSFVDNEPGRAAFATAADTSDAVVMVSELSELGSPAVARIERLVAASAGPATESFLVVKGSGKPRAREVTNWNRTEAFARHGYALGAASVLEFSYESEGDGRQLAEVLVGHFAHSFDDASRKDKA